MINYLVYILFYPLLWCISKLPFKVLYIISDGLYLLLYYVVGYRKKIVKNNLLLALPHLTDKEGTNISRKSFRHFVDIIMEMVKSFTITEKQINTHYSYTNSSILVDLYKNGKSTILVGAHYGNWEWVLNLNSFIPYKCVGAYTPITNPYFNKRILKSRKKFGIELVPTSKTIKVLSNNEKNKVQALYGLLSDQSPSLRKTFYWNKFFGVQVPIHTGAEMLAKKYDMNVVMMKTKKVRRGYYETTFSILTENAKSFPDYELTDLFLKEVEEQVKEQPEFYMWTHKRFKHKDKAPD